MLSLAFAQIVFTVIFKWKSAHRRRRRPARRLAAEPAQVAGGAYYYFTLVHRGPERPGRCTPSCDSPFGYALKAVRENPRRARYIGIDVRRHQLAAFVISGAFSGLAGGLFAFYNGSVFPDFAYFTKSFEPLVVALLGGVQSFFGPLAGAFGFKILEWLDSRQWPCTGRSSSAPSWWW